MKVHIATGEELDNHENVALKLIELFGDMTETSRLSATYSMFKISATILHGIDPEIMADIFKHYSEEFGKDGADEKELKLYKDLIASLELKKEML